MSENKLHERIRNLLKHANGTDNAVEAETFLAKAMELMAKHQIDASDLGEAGDRVIEEFSEKRAASGHVWRWQLRSQLARYYGCRVVLHPSVSQGKKFMQQSIIGRESAIVTLNLMFPYICKQVAEQAKDYAAMHGMSPTGAAKRVANALVYRVAELCDVQEDAVPDTSTPAGKNALLVLDQVTAYMEAAYRDIKTRNSRATTLHQGAMDRAAAISLHRQAEGSTQRAISGNKA